VREIFPIAGPVRRDISGIAYWQQMKIGRIVQFIDISNAAVFVPRSGPD